MIRLLRRLVPLHGENLADHFACGEISNTSVERGGAEFAAHIAANLRRKAQGITIMIAHQYAFDKVFILEAEEILDRAILL
ncbi:hypothetical protein SDC9_188760 [bioreactor metagenome]|uniref:Uncharacterized protein n=1 Tax=bioreactor metagenome TaxID=1076179 RepID=A0A645HQ89_9ZZZZ